MIQYTYALKTVWGQNVLNLGIIVIFGEYNVHDDLNTLGVEKYKYYKIFQ